MFTQTERNAVPGREELQFQDCLAYWTSELTSFLWKCEDTWKWYEFLILFYECGIIVILVQNSFIRKEFRGPFLFLWGPWKWKVLLVRKIIPGKMKSCHGEHHFRALNTCSIITMEAPGLDDNLVIDMFTLKKINSYWHSQEMYSICNLTLGLVYSKTNS